LIMLYYESRSLYIEITKQNRSFGITSNPLFLGIISIKEFPYLSIPYSSGNQCSLFSGNTFLTI
jgi:hypothetical protein